MAFDILSGVVRRHVKYETLSRVPTTAAVIMDKADMSLYFETAFWAVVRAAHLLYHPLHLRPLVGFKRICSALWNGITACQRFALALRNSLVYALLPSPLVVLSLVFHAFLSYTIPRTSL